MVRRLSPVQRRARGLAEILVKRRLIHRTSKGKNVAHEVARSLVPLLEVEPHYAAVLGVVLQRRMLMDSGVLKEEYCDQAKGTINIAQERALVDELLKRGTEGIVIKTSPERIRSLLKPAVGVLARRMRERAEEAAIKRRLFVEPRITERRLDNELQMTIRWKK
jgi:hypothetical protein